MSAVEFEVDGDGYPTEDSLAAIEALDFKDRWSDAARFLVEDFPKMAAMMPSAHVAVANIDRHGHPAKEVTFVTGGWSGCEDLINAVLGIVHLKHMYYAKWERGGLHVFVVPVSHLTLSPTGSASEEGAGSVQPK